jgi:hypothetical protein
MIESSPEATRPGPRPFSQIPPLWLKFFKMNLAFFESEKEYSSIGNTLLGVLCMMIILLIESVIAFLLGRIVSGEPIFHQPVFPQTYFSYAITCISILVIPASFYMSTGLIQLAAMILGGKGQFSKLAYLFSVLHVPNYFLSAIIALIILIPSIGLCLWPILVLPLIIYGIILQVRVIKVIHGFSTEKAVLTIFLPGIVIGVLAGGVAIIIIAILSLFGPAIGSVFSGITETL